MLRRIFIVRKVSNLRAGTARSLRQPYQKSEGPGEPQESGFSPNKCGSTARNVLKIDVMEAPIAR